MPPRPLTASVFLFESSSVVAHATCPSDNEMRRFRQIYGVTPNNCAIFWRRKFPTFSILTHHKQLLWALRSLKSYRTEAVNTDAEACTEKTIEHGVGKF